METIVVTLIVVGVMVASVVLLVVDGRKRAQDGEQVLGWIGQQKQWEHLDDLNQKLDHLLDHIQALELEQAKMKRVLKDLIDKDRV